MLYIQQTFIVCYCSPFRIWQIQFVDDPQYGFEWKSTYSRWSTQFTGFVQTPTITKTETISLGDESIGQEAYSSCVVNFISFPALLQTFPFHFSLSHFFHSLPSLYPLLSLSHDCSLCHFPSNSPLQFRFFLFRPYLGCTLDSLFASIQSSKREQKLYGSVLRHKFMIFFSKECVCNKHAEPWRKSWNLETISCCLKYLVTNDMFQMHVPQ